MPALRGKAVWEGQMRWLLPLALFPIISSPALAQIQHGTVAVIYYSKDKIIMAADSRALNENAPPSDSECKVAALYGKIIFVSSGAAVYEKGSRGDRVGSWTNTEENRRAYDAASLLYATSHDRVVGAATEWGKSISSHFQSLFFWHPEKIAFVTQGGSGILTRALIGGLDDSGNLILVQTLVMFKGQPSPALFPNPYPYPLAVGPAPYPVTNVVSCRGYCAIGEIEVEQEFVNLTSERAKKEAKEWKPPKRAKTADYDILRTRRLVELTIEYHAGDVGGSIDIVQMDKDGRVHWYAIKENCSEN